MNKGKEYLDFERQSTRNVVVRKIHQKYWEKACKNPAVAYSILVEEMPEIMTTDADISMELRGTEKIGNDQPYIFALNHPVAVETYKQFAFGPDNNYALPDYMCFVASELEKKLGKRVHFIATDPVKEEYREVLKGLGIILVKGGGDNNLEDVNARVSEYLDKGEHIALFPEGHGYKENSIGPLKNGFIHFSQQNNVKVVGGRLNGFDDVYHNLSLELSSPWTPMGSESTNDLAEKFRSEVMSKGHLGLTRLEVQKMDKGYIADQVREYLSSYDFPQDKTVEGLVSWCFDMQSEPKGKTDIFSAENVFFPTDDIGYRTLYPAQKLTKNDFKLAIQTLLEKGDLYLDEDELVVFYEGTSGTRFSASHGEDSLV